MQSPAELLERLEEFLAAQGAELADQELHRELARPRIEQGPPVVELYLTGVLPFDRRSLDLGAIEALVLEKFAPLVGAVKTQLQSSDYVIESDTILTRAEVERRVLEGLFDRDARYAGAQRQVGTACRQSEAVGPQRRTGRRRARRTGGAGAPDGGSITMQILRVELEKRQELRTRPLYLHAGRQRHRRPQRRGQEHHHRSHRLCAL